MNRKPNIVFNDEAHLIRFEGVFIVTSSWDKNGTIINFTRDFIGKRPETDVICVLEYVDSISRKIFFDIFEVFKSAIENQHKNINIIWKYDPDDESIYELGKVMEELTGQSFKFVKEDG